MGILTDDMKRVVREQRLGYIATVCSDGTPNLSPKGTTAVWDDDHLVFADIRSPQWAAAYLLERSLDATHKMLRMSGPLLSVWNVTGLPLASAFSSSCAATSLFSTPLVLNLAGGVAMRRSISR
jgi:hypothetical protein